MPPLLINLLLLGVQKGIGYFAKPRPAPLPFTVMAVAPAEMRDFLCDHPDAVCALKLFGQWSTQPKAEALCAALRTEIRDGQREHPGCLLFCCDFH